MTMYRVKVDFSQGVNGWSETYWFNATQDSVAATATARMLPKRFAMLPSSVLCQGVRASIDGVQRNSSYLVPPSSYFLNSGMKIQVPGQGTLLPELDQQTEDQTRVVLQMRTGFAGQRRTVRYIGGVPQQLLRDPFGRYNDQIDGGFGKALDAWQEEIINVWSVRGQVLGGVPGSLGKQQVKFPVKGIQQGSQTPAPLLGITVLWSGTGTFPWTVGQRLRATGFRPPKGQKMATINGTWYIGDLSTVGNLATIYLRNSDKVLPAMVNFTDNTFLRQVDYDYFPIEIYSPIRMGVHKRGKPAGVLRGRRPTPITLDP